MAVTDPQMRQLLSRAYAAGVHPQPDEMQLRQWLQVSGVMNWTPDEAERAFLEHISTEEKMIKPGLVSTRIRSYRQERALRDNAREQRHVRNALTSPTDRSGAIVGAYTGGPEDPNLVLLHQMAGAAIPNCTQCPSRDGARCVNDASGTPAKIPHTKRITAAIKAGWEPMMTVVCPACRHSAQVRNDPDTLIVDTDETGRPNLVNGKPAFIFRCTECQNLWSEPR